MQQQPIFAVDSMPPEVMAMLSASRAYIANITEIEFARSRTYGNYIIPGKEPGQQFSLTEITPRKNVIDYGDNKKIESPLSPNDIAKDLVREINGDAGFESFLGVFVCGKDGPSAEELKVEHARLEKFAQWCVRQGDDEWQTRGKIDTIPDLWKRMAVFLRIEREWCNAIQPNLECPGCGTNVKPNIAVCKDCGAILNREKAIALGILKPEHAKGSKNS